MITEATRKPQILVVQNEPIAREILCNLLMMAGYEVMSVQTGEQALLTLVRERGRIDCLFTEIELSGLVDGRMLANEFRHADAGKPVVFAAEAKPAKARRGVGTSYVSRPALPSKVVEAVNKVTGRADAALKARLSAPSMVSETAASEQIPLPIPAREACEPLRAVG